VCRCVDFYDAGEVQRPEYQLIGVYSREELEGVTRTITLQRERLARAVRAAKGWGVDLDA
jgi:hypothetical protein